MIGNLANHARFFAFMNLGVLRSIGFKSFFFRPLLNFYSPFTQENGIIYTSGYAKKYLKNKEPFNNGLHKKYGSSVADNMDRLFLETNNKPYTMILSGQHEGKIILKDYFNDDSRLLAQYGVIVYTKA